MKKQIPSMHKQRGAVLIVSLIMLLIITILGVNAMTTSKLEQQMSINNKDRHIALQAAEAALLDAEDYILNNSGLSTSVTDACTNGLCTSTSSLTRPLSTIESQVFDVSGKHFSYTGYDPRGDGSGDNPKYIIQFLNYVTPEDVIDLNYVAQLGDPEMYRITAIGYGALDGTRVILQVTYIKNI
jgi:type IV pilus assembly protein PilX